MVSLSPFFLSLLLYLTTTQRALASFTVDFIQTSLRTSPLSWLQLLPVMAQPSFKSLPTLDLEYHTHSLLGPYIIRFCVSLQTSLIMFKPQGSSVFFWNTSSLPSQSFGSCLCNSVTLMYVNFPSDLHM
jgi:hypothetical protein